MKRRQIIKSRLRNNRGFTLIEVVTVLVIIAIISVVVIARSVSTTDVDLASQLEMVKGHLRSAQASAMNTEGFWGINFSSATEYYLFQGVGSTTAIRLPGEENATVNLVTKGSALTITTVRRVTFDEYGRPWNPTTTLPETADVTIQTSGGNITVTKNTGFIP